MKSKFCCELLRWLYEPGGVDGAASLYGRFCTNATSESQKVQPCFHTVSRRSDASSKRLTFLFFFFWLICTRHLYLFMKVQYIADHLYWHSLEHRWKEILYLTVLNTSICFHFRVFDSAEMLKDTCRPRHFRYFNRQSSISAKKKKNHKALQIKQQTFLPGEPVHCRPYKAEPALPTVCSDKSITSTGMLNIFWKAR